MLKHVCIIPTKNEKVAKLVEEAAKFEYQNESIIITMNYKFKSFEVMIMEGVSTATYISLAGFCKGYTQALLRYV